VQEEAKKLGEHIRTGCRALPDPTPESVFEHVHVTMTPELAEQRRDFVDFVAEVAV